LIGNPNPSGENMTTNDVTGLESQVSMALAAVGIAIGETLVEHFASDKVLATLQREALTAYERLVHMPNSEPAQRMFSTFIGALRDPTRFDQPKD
jgi:hypothetical protein